MKFKVNITALSLAALIFVASNGVALFEHICNTSHTRSFSLFSDTSCNQEKEAVSCCKKEQKLPAQKAKDCCEEKQFFSKLNIEGFTAKQLLLKSLMLFEMPVTWLHTFGTVLQLNFENYYSGLSPPDNLHIILSCLQPDTTSLQVFRC